MTANGARVDASGHSHVIARNGTHVAAYDDASIDATFNKPSEGEGDSILLLDHSEVVAGNGVHVIAIDHTKAFAESGSYISTSGLGTAYAFTGSHKMQQNSTLKIIGIELKRNFSYAYNVVVRIAQYAAHFMRSRIQTTQP